MPRYKEYSYDQSVMIPIRFDEQILPGSIEEAIHCIVNRHIDMSLFDSRYKNDDDGAPAYDPRILLKILLLAYSRGITSSRKIEQLCRENIIFMAISAETKPDHATIAKFVSKMDKEIQWLFRDILLICQEMGLLGGELYAIDGCKIPSNASKEWSGTKQDYERKKQKLESTIAYLVNQHKENDTQESNAPDKDNERRIDNLEKKVAKIKKWIAEHEDKIGQRGNIKKSNITDNESAKMPSSHGVIQGYNGIASVDDKHQIVVSAKAYGEGQENVAEIPEIPGTHYLIFNK
jgi:transposase